jgi:predicted DNA-binding transcriptional regulator YafY
MDRSERFRKITDMLLHRGSVPIINFLDEMQISRATFKRDIEYMRDRFNAPIDWDRETRAYRLGKSQKGMPAFELPGLWFNSEEVYALLMMQHLLKELEPGLLSPHVQPLQTRLKLLLASEAASIDEIEKRVRLIRTAARKGKVAHFELAATAVLKRKRIKIQYWARGRDETTERVVSPQRMTFYKQNWYLDAWCHLRKDLRSFAVDGIKTAEMLVDAAKNVSETELDRVLASGYGIFSGAKTTTAKLRFSPTAARWVADEEWHPQQKGVREADGSWLLELPFSDARELIMDILRYGPDVEVLAPASLRAAVSADLNSALKKYR